MRKWLVLGFALLALVSGSFGAAAQDEPVTITYLVYDNVDVWEKLVEDFEAENPDIHVQIHLTAEDFLDVMTVRSAVGMLSDVVILNWGTAKLVDAGLFLDLTPYVERDGIDLDNYILQEGLAQRNGKIVGLPWGTFTPIMFYNKNQFDESGLAYPTADWDWDDLNQAATALTRRGAAGEQNSRWGVNNLFEDFEFGWRSWIAQNGGALLSDDLSHTRVTEPAAIEAVDYLVEMHDRGIMPPYTLDEDDANLYNGRVSIEIGHPFGPFETFAEEDPVAFDWGAEIIPKGDVRAASMNTLIVGVNAKTKYPEAAWRFVKFASSAYVAKRISLLGRALPSHRQAFTDPAFWEALSNNVGADVTNLAQTMPLQMEHPFWIPVHPAQKEIMDDIWNEIAHEMFVRGESPRTFFEEVAGEVNALLAHAAEEES